MVASVVHRSAVGIGSLSHHLRTPLHTSFGGASALWWPCSPSPPKVFILFIPGNPGLASYYIPYLSSIYTSPELRGQVEILALSHRGHAPVPTNYESFTSNSESQEDEKDTSLKSQIKHKRNAVEAIRRAYPKTGREDDVKLVLIGHSVGAYIGLKVLEQVQEQVDGLQLLFPTVMNIAKAPKARTLPLLLATNPLVQAFILPLPLFILSLLPTFVVVFLIRVFTGMPAPGLETTLELIVTPGALLNAARMARDEFITIRDLDINMSRSVKALKARGGSIRSYWSKGNQDQWAPEGHRRDLESALLLTRVELPPHLNASPDEISKVTRPKSFRSRTLAMGGTLTRAAGRRLTGRSLSGRSGLPSPSSPHSAPAAPQRPSIVPTSPAARSSMLAHRKNTPRRRPSVSLATAKRSFDGTITLELPQGEDWGFLDDGEGNRENNGIADSSDEEGTIGGTGTHRKGVEANQEDVFGSGGRIETPSSSASVPQSFTEHEDSTRRQHQHSPELRARTDLARHKTRQGELTSTVCNVGMPHAFCLKYGQEMGVISSWWIANDFL